MIGAGLLQLLGRARPLGPRDDQIGSSTSADAVSVMNTFSASLGMTLTSTLARSMPASCRTCSSVASPVTTEEAVASSIASAVSCDCSIEHERSVPRRPARRRPELPTTAVAGDDRVARKRLDLFHHALATEVIEDLAFGEELHERAQREGDRQIPSPITDHRDDACTPVDVQRLDLAEPHARDGDDHLVNGIE